MIRKTKAGTWAVSLRDPTKKSGAEDARIQKTFEKYKDAVAYENEVRNQIQKGEYVAPSDDTVGEVAERWLERKTAMEKRNGEPAYRRSTLQAWNNHVNRYIKPDIGELKARSLDAETVERIALEKWGKRVSAKMVNKVLTTLSAVLGLAKRHKLVRDNAAQEAERLKTDEGQEGLREVSPDEVYNKAEVRKLIEATEPGTMERLLVMVPALTGVRVGEELALTWDAIDLKAEKLHVRLNLADAGKGAPEPLFQPPKTKSGRRTIPLPAELVHELKVWKLKCPVTERGLVFATIDGKPLHRKAVLRVLAAAVEKANEKAQGNGNEKAKLKRLTPHGLRHTFASLLLADGVSVPEVSHYLGHKSSAITMTVYAHFVREETRPCRAWPPAFSAG